jgi:flagellar hook-associated protein 3 FlgL
VRITDGMVSEASRAALQRARLKVFRASQVASTGVRVESPGDAPSAAGRARRLREEGSRLEATMRAADEGRRGLEVVDDTLTHFADLFAEAREIAVQGGNDTLGAAERGLLADEIAGLRADLLQSTATRFDGRYVLNGVGEDQPPYDPAGNFVGQRALRSVEASAGHLIPAGIAIGDVLSPVAGTDAFAALTALETALRTSNTAGIAAGIDAMRDLGIRVADARGDVGNRMMSFDLAYALGERLSDRTQTDLTQTVDADVFDALTELQRSQTALEQALSIAAKLPIPGLAQRR